MGLAFARLEEGYENAIKDYNKKQVRGPAGPSETLPRDFQRHPLCGCALAGLPYPSVGRPKALQSWQPPVVLPKGNQPF